MRLLVQIIWLVLYLYYIEKISELEKGRGKRIVSGGIALGMVLLTQIPAVFGASEQAVFWSRTGGWIAVVLVLFLYVLFYSSPPIQFPAFFQIQILYTLYRHHHIKLSIIVQMYILFPP